MYKILDDARIGLLTIALLACGLVNAASREECEREFKPETGQQGKDVIWVPTPDSLVTSMLEAARITPEDRVFDLGSGDGKIPIAAAKQFGATAVGVEYNPKMVQLARCYAAAAGVEEKVDFIQGDIFETDFSSATVLTLYLLPDLNEKLKPTILELRPGTRVVSHSFTMGDWRPDENIDGNMAYLWIVPAQVDGTWELTPSDGSQPLRLQLRQKYQDIEGMMSAGGQEAPLSKTSLRGDRIAFTYVDPRGKRIELKGRAAENRLQLTASGGKPVTYVGTRERGMALQRDSVSNAR